MASAAGRRVAWTLAGAVPRSAIPTHPGGDLRSDLWFPFPVRLIRTAARTGGQHQRLPGLRPLLIPTLCAARPGLNDPGAGTRSWGAVISTWSSACGSHPVVGSACSATCTAASTGWWSAAAVCSRTTARKRSPRRAPACGWPRGRSIAPRRERRGSPSLRCNGVPCSKRAISSAWRTISEGLRHEVLGFEFSL